LVGLALPVLAVVLAAIAYLDVSLRYRRYIVTPEQAPERPVAIVFGAAVYPDGRLSTVLADRVLTAAALYKAGKVRKLLFSGDNRFIEYNEPAAMGAFARRQGLPATALAYDYAGRRTYDTCWRARHVFGQETVLLVSQGFHLPRAVYLCRQLGLDAVGVVADRRFYARLPFWMMRETLARIQAWLDVHILHPRPVGGEPIDIFAPDYQGRMDTTAAYRVWP
jgi:SanA protein